MEFMSKVGYGGILFLALVMSVCSVGVWASNMGKDSLLFSFDEQIVNGTTGTPLGGFGCGGIKFDANTGTFSVMTAPPADAYDFKGKKNASLQLYMYYRFLYNYEDTKPEIDSKGLSVFTSLNALRRTSYQFLGSWCKKVIEVEYPAWVRRITGRK